MKKATVLVVSAVLTVWMATGMAEAALRLPRIFTDHMVLQQQMPIAVWGWCQPGQSVQVSLAGRSATGVAGPDGKWLVRLPAMQADGKPQELTISAEGQTIRFKDVLLGEVWLCSGQSNMNREVPVKQSDPDIRLFWIEASTAPQKDDLGPRVVGWTPATPEAVAPVSTIRRQQWGNPRSSGFAEVGYVFGRKIHAELKVPVGLIKAAFGGSQVMAWVPRPGIEKEFPFGQELPRERGYKGHIPGLLYQSMIHGMVPFTIRGVVWYQGEDDGRNSHYDRDMTRWIQCWRKLWDNPDMPFYFAQIAPTTYASGMLKVWQAQVKVMHTVPHTGMAVSNDIYFDQKTGRYSIRPYPDHPQWSIAGSSNPHPPNKHIIARRLADIALVKTYHQPDRVIYGPMYDSHAIRGDKVIVKFKYTGTGLTTRDGKAPTWFELSDGTTDKRHLVYHPAQATIVGPDTIEVHCEQVKNPKFVRFGWHPLAHLNLVNKQGLPAVCFRTDDQPW